MNRYKVQEIFKRIKNIYIDTELVLPMYNAHPYFSLKNLGKKVHIIHSRTQSTYSQVPQIYAYGLS